MKAKQASRQSANAKAWRLANPARFTEVQLVAYNNVTQEAEKLAKKYRAEAAIVILRNPRGQSVDGHEDLTLVGTTLTTEHIARAMLGAAHISVEQAAGAVGEKVEEDDDEEMR